MQKHNTVVWKLAQKQSKSHSQTHLTHFFHAQSKIRAPAQSGCHSQWPPLFPHMGPAADVVTSHSDVRWSVCVIRHDLPDLLVIQEIETFVTGAFNSWTGCEVCVTICDDVIKQTHILLKGFISFRSLTQSSSLTFIIVEKFRTCWL